MKPVRLPPLPGGSSPEEGTAAAVPSFGRFKGGFPKGGDFAEAPPRRQKLHIPRRGVRHHGSSVSFCLLSPPQMLRWFAAGTPLERSEAESRMAPACRDQRKREAAGPTVGNNRNPLPWVASLPTFCAMAESGSCPRARNHPPSSKSTAPERLLRGCGWVISLWERDYGMVGVQYSWPYISVRQKQAAARKSLISTSLTTSSPVQVICSPSL